MTTHEMIQQLTYVICENDQGCYLFREDAKTIAEKLKAADDLADFVILQCYDKPEIMDAVGRYEKAGAEP